MADGTKIEWTDATWNPITGCSVVSPGCTNCYAMKLAGTRLKHIPSRAGLTRDTKAGPVWTGEVRFNEATLDEPLRWRRPRMIFVCAHGDLFAENVPDAWIDRVFAVMGLSPQHTFQVLTKRPERMRAYLKALVCGTGYRPYVRRPGWAAPDPRDGDRVLLLQEGQTWPLSNVWLGVSVEDQKRADERIPVLLDTPAAVRWISAEPLLGPISLEYVDLGGDGSIDALSGLHIGPGDESRPSARIDWVVAGGESGPGARPMHPDWPRSLRNQCDAAGVPFHFKQWGAWVSEVQSPEDVILPGVCVEFWRGEPPVFLVGKKAAGRLLDGATHDAFPEARSC